MFGYVTELVQRHRAQPDGSMLSHLANDQTGAQMTDGELGTTSLLLLIAAPRQRST